MISISSVYLKDKSVWAGQLVVPHGLVHEQEKQTGEEGQSDENEASDLQNNTHH